MQNIYKKFFRFHNSPESPFFPYIFFIIPNHAKNRINIG